MSDKTLSDYIRRKNQQDAFDNVSQEQNQLHNFGATHLWLDGYKTPVVNGMFRRHFYKKINNIWFSLDNHNEWKPSSNDSAWFAKEVADGFFVRIEHAL